MGNDEYQSRKELEEELNKHHYTSSEKSEILKSYDDGYRSNDCGFGTERSYDRKPSKSTLEKLHYTSREIREILDDD